jgi:flagellar basal body-associated protein FliL
MAEKQAGAQAETAPVSGDAKKPSRKKSFLIVALLMMVEGVAIFFGTKMLTGSAPASADAAPVASEPHGAPVSGEHGGGHGGEAKNAPFESEFGEIAVSECRPTNRESGRTVTFRMRVSVLVKAADLEKTKSLIESNKARIDDRINFVIRSADPAFLNEPTLETIKRRLKSELDRLMGDEHLIEEVLIPEMLASAPGL